MTSASNLRDQKERREIIRTGNQPASSFFQEAVKGRSLEGGNYTAQRDLVITGEAPSVSYPSGASWCGDAALVGPERPLGVAVDEMECTGTAEEVARSIDALAAPAEVSAREAEPVALVVSSANDNPTTSSLVAQPGSAISPADEATLKALLGRGLRRRKL